MTVNMLYRDWVDENLREGLGLFQPPAAAVSRVSAAAMQPSRKVYGVSGFV